MLGLKSPAVQGAVCGVIGGAGIIGSVYVLHAIHPHAAIAGFGIGLVGMCVAAELHERRRTRLRDAEFAERRARFIETFERAAGEPVRFPGGLVSTRNGLADPSTPRTEFLLHSSLPRPGRTWVLGSTQSGLRPEHQSADAAAGPAELLGLAFAVARLAWRTTVARAKARSRLEARRP